MEQHERRTLVCLIRKNVTASRYAVKSMKRPKEHNDRTAAALLDAAERIVERDGIEALSLRRLAQEAGTTTRAVYSLFGSKDGLLVALGTRAFEILGVEVRSPPATDDPAADLVHAGVAVFRAFAIGHPVLFRIGVQRIGTPTEVWSRVRPTASDAWGELHTRVERLRESGGLGGTSVDDATIQFRALCEGLAAVELGGVLASTGTEPELIWREALAALFAGLARSG